MVPLCLFTMNYLLIFKISLRNLLISLISVLILVILRIFLTWVLRSQGPLKVLLQRGRLWRRLRLLSPLKRLLKRMAGVLNPPDQLLSCCNWSD
ncbi:MAG: hypothetical protein [Microviridae sp.]|nr:MAG: hypothetical protein [Microviridae sp.]